MHALLPSRTSIFFFSVSAKKLVFEKAELFNNFRAATCIIGCALVLFEMRTFVVFNQLTQLLTCSTYSGQIQLVRYNLITKLCEARRRRRLLTVWRRRLRARRSRSTFKRRSHSTSHCLVMSITGVQTRLNSRPTLVAYQSLQWVNHQYCHSHSQALREQRRQRLVNHAVHAYA